MTPFSFSYSISVTALTVFYCQRRFGAAHLWVISKILSLPYTVSLKLFPSAQCVHGILGVDQSNTAGSIGWQREAFDQDIVEIEFH